VSRFTTHLPFSTRMLIAVGKVNLFKVILLFCLIGVALYISGIYQETGANISLRRAGGAEAVLQHRTRLAENALGPIVYLRKGLLGQLQQSGANNRFVAQQSSTEARCWLPWLCSFHVACGDCRYAFHLSPARA
jgi:hypothetical protein